MPHMMKRSFIALSIFACSLFVMSACSNMADSQCTPRIFTDYFILHPVDSTAKVDTLCIIASPNVYDTIHIGDTVTYNVQINAVTSLLTGFEFSTIDTSAFAISLALTPEFMQALADSSSVAEGKLYFKTGYVAAGFGVKYIARKYGRYDFAMMVSTTSKFSPAYLSFTQPVF